MPAHLVAEETITVGQPVVVEGRSPSAQFGVVFTRQHNPITRQHSASRTGTGAAAPVVNRERGRGAAGFPEVARGGVVFVRDLPVLKVGVGEDVIVVDEHVQRLAGEVLDDRLDDALVLAVHFGVGGDPTAQRRAEQEPAAALAGDPLREAPHGVAVLGAEVNGPEKGSQGSSPVRGARQADCCRAPL